MDGRISSTTGLLSDTTPGGLGEIEFFTIQSHVFMLYMLYIHFITIEYHIILEYYHILSLFLT